MAITLLGILAKHKGHRLESDSAYVPAPGRMYGGAHLYLYCRTCKLWVWDQTITGENRGGKEPRFPEFRYGWGDDPDTGRYAWSWHIARDVAAIYHGGDYIEISVSGTWQPGMPVTDMEAYETVNVRSGDTGEYMMKWEPESLTEYFIKSGQAG